MGKASSAKKVARAARAGGGRVKGLRQRNLLFPGAIGAIVVLGGALVGYSWNDRQDEASSEPPVMNQDHWHSAYGVYVCDHFVNSASETESPEGIHSHGDNVIHIHPFSAAAAGDNATLGVFFTELAKGGFELSNDELTVDGETYTEGEDQCDGEDAELVVAQWKDVETSDRDPALITRDFDDIRFRDDGEGYTIAFVPEDRTDDIPKPESAAQLADLGAADAGDVTSTTAAGGEGSATTAAGGSSTTAAGGSSTTAPTGEPSEQSSTTASTAPEAGG
jgi:hypothetical protein